MKKLISHSESETRLFAANLARKLKPPVFICLSGDLGTGKTVFTKGLAEGFGIPAREIKSPTYTFVKEYRLGKLHFYHFDFYRIEDADELMASELQDIFERKNAFIVVEWPEHISAILPDNRLDIRFQYVNESTRSLTFLP